MSVGKSDERDEEEKENYCSFSHKNDDDEIELEMGKVFFSKLHRTPPLIFIIIYSNVVIDFYIHIKWCVDEASA